MKDLKGFIFDIQGYSTHDGPGCRTVVFFKGCPLQCRWCANPESWDFNANPLFRETKCILGNRTCSRCLDACPHGAVRYGGEGEPFIVLDRAVCAKCRELACAHACLDEGIMVCGKWYTPEELLRILNRDRDYWGINGGVTFTGGEPLSQPEFLMTMLRLCRAGNIHTGIETSAFARTDVFLACMELLDFVFIDLKHMDGNKHKAFTGADNGLIKENIAALAEELRNERWRGRLVVRMPVIRGFNDDLENARQTAGFLRELGLAEINLLPFHRMGESKWRQVGEEYDYALDDATSEEVMAGIQAEFLDRGILCYVGSDTPF